MLRSLIVISLANTWWYIGDCIEYIGRTIDEAVWDDEVMRLYNQDVDMQCHDD